MAKKTENTEQVQKITQAQYYYAVGRRRLATAQIRLYTAVVNEPVKIGDKSYEVGAFVVNGRSVEDYFPGEIFKKMYQEPFRTTNTMSRFATSIKVEGGGLAGQLGAAIHGISRALIKVDNEKFRPILKKRGLLTRDPRAKERRKAGFAGKARAKKQSPKR